jgi:hypothetical protein
MAAAGARAPRSQRDCVALRSSQPLRRRRPPRQAAAAAVAAAQCRRLRGPRRQLRNALPGSWRSRRTPHRAGRPRPVGAGSDQPAAQTPPMRRWSLAAPYPGGSGIGLVLSRQIAEGHRGALPLGNRTDGQDCIACLRLRVTGRNCNHSLTVVAPMERSLHWSRESSASPTFPPTFRTCPMRSLATAEFFPRTSGPAREPESK